MNKLSVILACVFVLSACYPWPPYSGNDPRCKKWKEDLVGAKSEDIKNVAGVYDVIDRFHYYVCINSTNSFQFPEPDVFLADADAFLKSIPILLSGKVPADQVYLMSEICLKIAMVKPDVAKRHLASFDTVEAYADKAKENFWKYKAINTIRYSKYLLGQGTYLRAD